MATDLDVALRAQATALRRQADALEAVADELGEARGREPTVADLTVADIAEAHGKSASTVRSWLSDVPGVYRLGQELRIPRDAWRAHLDQLAGRDESEEAGEVDIGAWREERAGAGGDR